MLPESCQNVIEKCWCGRWRGVRDGKNCGPLYAFILDLISASINFTKRKFKCGIMIFCNLMVRGTNSESMCYFKSVFNLNYFFAFSVVLDANRNCAL